MRRAFLCFIAAGALVTQTGVGFGQTNVSVLHLDDETRNILRDTTADTWFKKDAFTSTVLGGLLAVIGGFAAVWYAHRLQQQHAKQEEEEFKANVLRAIRRELEVMTSVYEQAIGAELRGLSDGQVFETRLALTQDWFTVFSANAVHLGRLDADSSHRIVSIYTRVKQLIEEFRINNDYLQMWGEPEILATTGDADHQVLARKGQVHRWLVGQAAKLKILDEQLKLAADEFFALLDKRGIT